MANPYDTLNGGGPVNGREVIKVLDEEDQEIGDLEKTDPAYQELNLYLPKPDESRALFANRFAPPVTDVRNSHLRLACGGQWQRKAVTALESLQFWSPSGHPVSATLPLFSRDPIDFRVPDTTWVAYGHVEMNELNIEGFPRKYYAKVKFMNSDGKRVAAFWCWP